MTEAESNGRFNVALEEARRGFDSLAAEVSTIRDRAVSTLGMGGLAASFLGGLTIRDGAEVSCWTFGAVAAFVVLAALAVIVLWPQRFHVSIDPADLVSWAEVQNASTDEIQRDLALHLGTKYDENRRTVDRLASAHAAASCAFLAEIVALMADLMSR